MKKLLVLCAMIVALGFVAGCTCDKPAPSAPDAVPPQEAPADEAPAEATPAE